MSTVIVSGRFINEQYVPIEGSISFMPQRLWVERDDVAIATLAPAVDLVDGQFSVELTPTDQETFDWYYTVTCPVGVWHIKVEGEEPLLLKNLLPGRFA